MITQDQVTAVGGFLLSNICSAAEPLATTSKFTDVQLGVG